MIFSSTFASIMHRMFLDYGIYTPSIEVTLDENAIYNKNLVVDLKNKEIPICIMRFFRELCLKYNDDTKLVIPLYERLISESKRTFNSVLRSLFSNNDCNGHLRKVTTNKGEVYYGKKGLILDSNFNPIIMFSLKCHEVEWSKDTAAYVYDKIICRVSPNVFLEPNKLIHKGIIKYIIPFMQEGIIDIPNYVRFRREGPLSRQVIIEDFSDWFISPVKPNPSENINDSLNDCLVDNLEEIMNIINE